MCGITDVKVAHYSFACIGMLPNALLMTYFGSMVDDIEDLLDGDYKDDPAYIISLILGGVIGIAVIVYMGYVSKKEMNKILEKEE